MCGNNLYTTTTLWCPWQKIIQRVAGPLPGPKYIILYTISPPPPPIYIYNIYEHKTWYIQHGVSIHLSIYSNRYSRNIQFSNLDLDREAASFMLSASLSGLFDLDLETLPAAEAEASPPSLD